MFALSQAASTDGHAIKQLAASGLNRTTYSLPTTVSVLQCLMLKILREPTGSQMLEVEGIIS